MKKIITILLLVSGSIHAQDTLMTDSSESINEKILDYVHDYIGKKVGQGVCSELVVGAVDFLNRQGSNVDMDSLREINISDIQKGDIIVIDSLMCADGSAIVKHIGIVYNILPDNKISYANQNAGEGDGRTEKVSVYGRLVDVEIDSHVLLSILHLPSIINGKITILRF